MEYSKLVNCIPELVSNNIEKTVEYYKNILGFRAVTHYDKSEKFAALYRDDVEIIIIQAKHGKVLPNNKRYGSGYDVYIDPKDVKGVDPLYEEFKNKGAKIVKTPSMADYGCYEFVIEDIDGRLIGIGRVADKVTFFGNQLLTKG